MKIMPMPIFHASSEPSTKYMVTTKKIAIAKEMILLIIRQLSSHPTLNFTLRSAAKRNGDRVQVFVGNIAPREGSNTDDAEVPVTAGSTHAALVVVPYNTRSGRTILHVANASVEALRWGRRPRRPYRSRLRRFVGCSGVW